ncbi:di-trans,poly-cis-decaprenylcistransferas-like protein [Bimuria novae-zelandiae CBS 107.79]|uniref:ditrans,polycis-polyprenyl diphosphate synthase [(2E,6E)-farnesyldiphosphate specific] n=1 Tax=Bimuria novae-zelandiae CBS 107.79 TaxID=1447943 RepID=A0A6A5VG80_9PLEO|nr:di-trans,poly-cis-decaprenylcistransferas-like protein [Bimuria novae-zelandiae CBS 107.79]
MAAIGITKREELAFRRGVINGKQLTAKEREELMKPFLPLEPIKTSAPSALSQSPKSPKLTQRTTSAPKPKPTPIRTFLHIVLHTVISFVFSIFFRFRRAWRLFSYKVRGVLRHHHHTPEWIVNDVKSVEQLPKHLSVILEHREDDEDQGNAGLEGLVQDVCEIAAWTASAGIPLLSIYERTGVLKNYVPALHAAIQNNLESYFGTRRRPTLTVKAPHTISYSPPGTPSSEPTENGSTTSRPHLTVLLLSEHDGRDTLVDLTVTLATMAQKGDIRKEQIDMNLVNAELSDYVSSEPDLLVLFSPTVVLKGYPPWQLRLTEIFHLPDNKGVNYQVFLKALKKFGKAEFRVGK